MRIRGLYLAVAAFTLAVQTAAMTHLPALHAEPVSACHDVGAHFCAETVEQETGPCMLCQVGLNGVFQDLPVSTPIALKSETLAAPLFEEAASSFTLSAHSPRGPPLG